MEDLVETLRELEKESILRKVEKVSYDGDVILLKVLDILSKAGEAISKKNLDELKRLQDSLSRIHKDIKSYGEKVEKEEGIQHVAYPYLYDIERIKGTFSNVVKEAEEGDWDGAYWGLHYILMFPASKLLFSDVRTQAIALYKIFEKSKEKLGEVV